MENRFYLLFSSVARLNAGDLGEIVVPFPQIGIIDSHTDRVCYVILCYVVNMVSLGILQYRSRLSWPFDIGPHSSQMASRPTGLNALNLLMLINCVCSPREVGSGRFICR